MRVAFAGSPAPAVPVLEALVLSAHEVTLVVSQPDRPRGRRGAPQPTPVAAWALERGIPVMRPDSINAEDALARLRDARVGALAVAAFGQLLRSDVLDGWPCINVHYSLLPAYRGAAPVERAIMDGRECSGVTIMQMDPGLDTGPIISSQELPIGPDDDTGTMLARMAEAGGRLLVAALDDLEAGRMVTREQPEEGVSLAPRIVADDLPLDPGLPAARLADRVRALRPHIGARLGIDGDVFKIWSAHAEPGGGTPGLSRDGERLILATADGQLVIDELQPPGKGRMAAADFLRGRRGELGLDSR